ncbi:MAG: hypothetical protein KBA40_03870 [Candidatus Peribacteraceae bacterium]|nr:hypothetical protein [Candidatus Peribacteraceae bacterium]MBP9850496.1 hypothetical protein [Candidatus Peribacteraceae bacterium]
MEKSIHSHLFAALVSTKEQRLAFMAPEKPEDHDSLEQQIEQDLKDPSKDQKDIEARLAELQGSKHLTAGSNVDDWTALREKAAKRNEEIKDLEKARALTSDADFKKIEEDMKKGDGTSASAKIVEMLGKIAGLADNTSERPHNAVLQAQAYNEVITKIQSLDTDNKITLVPGGVGGIEDDAMLQTAKDEKPKTFKPGGDIATAVENFNKLGQAPQTKEAAKQALIDAVKERKDELWTEMFIVTKQVPQVVDSQKIVQEYLNQIKELVTLQNDLINGGASAAPTVAPVDPTQAAPVDPNAPKAAPTTLIGKGAELLKNVISGIADHAKNVIAKGAEALDGLQKDLTDKEKSELKDKLNEELKKQGANKHIEQNKDTGKLEIKDGAPPEVAKAADAPSEPEKTKLQELLDFFKELITFLRGERLAGGDLGVLRSEIESIDEQIAKIKKDNPDFSKKPDIVQQITALEVKKNDLKATIDQGKNLGTQVVADARTFVRDSANAGTPLYLRVEKDKDGNVFLVGMPNAPGATPEKCKSHMQYMTDRLQKVHPELRLNQRASTDQRVYFNIYGDVNINSKNDNRRIVDNRTKVDVRGKNNTTTVGVSADGSQNGSNDSFGALGASQEGTAKNKASARPSVKAETIVPAPPVLTKPKRVVTEEIKPESGSL